MCANGETATFIVTTVLSQHRGCGAYGFGRLSVRTGEIALDTWPIVRRLVTQTSGPVVAIHARLALAGKRHGFVVRDGRRWCGVMPGWRGSGAAIQEAIEGAGFELRHEAMRFRSFAAWQHR